MKTPLILMAGIALGWLGSELFRASNQRTHGQPADAAAGTIVPRQGTLSASRATSPRQRLGAADSSAVAFEARLKSAIRQAVELPENSAPLLDSRFSNWLAGIELPQFQRDQIAREFQIYVEAGSKNPFAAGSAFDHWLRGKFSEDFLASWTAQQTEHSIDQTERRANRLLIGLQASLPLSSAQKDALYPQLVEWAKENPANLLTAESFNSGELGKRFDKLAALLPDDQQAPFTEWVTEFLPSYWQQESNAE